MKADSGESQPVALGDRLRGTYDARELEQAALTSKLPIEIAATAQRLEDAERALAEAPAGSGVELAFVTTLGVLAVAIDAALALEPAVRYAGILLSEVGSASNVELGAILALPLMAGALNLVAGLTTGDLLVRGERLAGIGAAGALVVTSGTLAVIRVGVPADMTDWAEIAFFTLAPSGLALFVGVLGARCRARAEPAQRAGRLVAAGRRRLTELREEERVAWSERTKAAATLDRVVPSNLPLVAAAGGVGLDLSPWFTSAFVVLALGFVAFFAAGCDAQRSTMAAEVPSAFAILVDTSPSMASFDLGQIAGGGVRAAESAGLLPGGAVLSAYRTTEDGIASAYDGESVPRRFPGKERPEVQRARWFEAVESELESAEWPEGDSTVLRGLARVGESLALVPAERKVVLLVSDCRDHLEGHHYFAKRVPKPEPVLKALTDEATLPNLTDVAVIVCGVGEHPNEDGTPFGSRQNAAVVEVMEAVVEAGGGTFERLPSCSMSDLTLGFKAHHEGGRK